MLVRVDNVAVGDKIRFSTELLEQIEDNPHHRSQLVRVIKIEEDVSDGTKMIYVGNVG